MADFLANRLTGLETSSTAELRDRWERAFNCTVPKRASRDLVLRALAYHTQVQAEGGRSKATRKRLARLADPKGNAGRPPRLASLRLKPGNRGDFRAIRPRPGFRP